MDKKSIIETTLSIKERQTLAKELSTIDYDPLGSDLYIQKLRKKIYAILSDNLINTLTNQRSTSSLASAVVVNNVPIDEVVYGLSGIFKQQVGGYFSLTLN